MANSNQSDFGDGNSHIQQIDHLLETASSSLASKFSSDVFAFVNKKEDGTFFCLIYQEQSILHTWSTRSTSNFRKHFLAKHSKRYVAKDKSQSKLSHFGFAKGTKSNSEALSFTNGDKKHADDMLINWIGNHSQPFSVVEHQDFNEFCHTLRSDFPLPRRSTVCARILKRWEQEKVDDRQRLEMDLHGRRCGMTTDMCTSTAKQGYMAMTLHYIDAKWDMQSVIIAFVRIMYPHTAQR